MASLPIRPVGTKLYRRAEPLGWAALSRATIAARVASSASFSSSIRPITSACRPSRAALSLLSWRSSSSAVLAPRGARPVSVRAPPALRVVKVFSTLKLASRSCPAPAGAGASGRGLPLSKLRGAVGCSRYLPKSNPSTPSTAVIVSPRRSSWSRTGAAAVAASAGR